MASMSFAKQSALGPSMQDLVDKIRRGLSPTKHARCPATGWGIWDVVGDSGHTH